MMPAEKILIVDDDVNLLVLLPSATPPFPPLPPCAITLASRSPETRAAVAQLDRALPSEGRGLEFESQRLRHFLFHINQDIRPAS